MRAHTHTHTLTYCVPQAPVDEEAQEQGQGQSASSATQEHVVGLGYESCACNVTSNHVAAWHPDTGI